MATMNISLPDQMKQWVEEQVATGQYGNSSDYMRDLLRREQQRMDARQKLQQLVDDALASGINTRSREELFELIMSRADAAIAARKSA